VEFHDLVEYLGKKGSSGDSPLFHLRFYNTPDAPSSHFLSSTDINTDLTIFVALETANTSLRSASPLPALKLLVRYNQLLFSAERVACIIDQLAQIVIDAATHPDKSIGALKLLTDKQLQLLPNPSTDLHWGKFRGPIHEIFSENAARYPDRPCVVETASTPGSSDRTFSYRHINEASNVLAHYLIARGVTLGDVVMVYAHRGVDLVVAVMGILKAGGTFSVIGMSRCLLFPDLSRSCVSSCSTKYLSQCRQTLRVDCD
jgi:L-2-aminoadipate reductase